MLSPLPRQISGYAPGLTPPQLKPRVAYGVLRLKPNFNLFKAGFKNEGRLAWVYDIIKVGWGYCVQKKNSKMKRFFQIKKMFLKLVFTAVLMIFYFFQVFRKVLSRGHCIFIKCTFPAYLLLSLSG